MNKIPWNEPTYGEKRTIYRKLRDPDERQNKEMEGYSMLLGWNNQYCENDCNPYQITNGIFHRTRTKNFTICMEMQKTPSSQSNLEKE